MSLKFGMDCIGLDTPFPYCDHYVMQGKGQSYLKMKVNTHDMMSSTLDRGKDEESNASYDDDDAVDNDDDKENESADGGYDIDIGDHGRCAKHLLGRSTSLLPLRGEDQSHHGIKQLLMVTMWVDSITIIPNSSTRYLTANASVARWLDHDPLCGLFGEIFPVTPTSIFKFGSVGNARKLKSRLELQ
ncbi:hypothetical protein HAX54_020854 [Datura stramonium]|uniref:Uncharacterized protein n=1 Tax=Datura stramonium TaxID=4076 RepID=A0ABS8UTP2_DATST|nr:hypothetical protein [Datura stramonium]